MIFAGVWLVQQFDWILYVFGAFLILMVAVVVNAAIRLYRLFRPGWRDEL